MLQICLLLPPFLVLPIALPATRRPARRDPSIWLLWILVLMVGLPFFAVTTASPVLQRWFSETGEKGSRDPYFLYAAGNAGSLIGLLAYPILIEPQLTLHEQATMWTVGYACFVLVAGLCARRVLAAGRRPRPRPPGAHDARRSAGPFACAGSPWRRCPRR